MSNDSLQLRLGHATATGKRDDNQDFVAALIPGNHRLDTQGAVAVVADGVGGHAGGRVAAEVTVRGFLDAYYSLPETLGVERAAARALSSINRWVVFQGRNDTTLRSMASTFTALVVRGRQAHVVHVGDTRVYRLRGSQLACLTQDHTHKHPDLSHVLHRAVGIDEEVRADYSVHALEVHDRYLLCSDGVYEALPRARLAELLAQRSEPQDSAQRLVDAALEAGSQDNASALVLDVLALPAADRDHLERSIEGLRIAAPPKEGETVDGFEIGAMISNGRYSRLYRARDTREQRDVVLKFPQERVADDATYRRAFLREAWIAARVTSPWVSKLIELPPGRQTRLYSVIPFYQGHTLEHFIAAKKRYALETGADLGIKLCKAVAALHRQRIIHRDIKPDNIMLLADGGMKLIDLGVARLPALPDAPNEDVPGTPSYMAPEMFDGARGDERSDVYAIGVTLYRLFSGGAYPYGEIEPFSRPRFTKRTALATHRPDLPSWLDHAVMKAVSADPTQRHADAMELAFELENGLAQGASQPTRKRSLYDRNPLRFWQMISAALLIALIVSLVARMK
jgi:serine/threonine protein phosphatase PrpC